MGVKTLSNLIEFDRSDVWLTAPLKTVSESDIRNLNSQLSKNYQGYFDSITPHFYNRVSFVRLKNTSYDEAYGGAYIPYGTMGSGDNLRREFTVLGNIDDSRNETTRKIYMPVMDDYAIYYELAPVSEYNFNASDIEPNPPLFDDVITVSIGCTPSSGQIVVPDIGGARTAIRGRRGIIPNPTHNYDNWLVVKTWAVYYRGPTETRARYQGGDGTTTNNILPAVCFDIRNAHWFNITDYTSKPRSWGGTSQAIIMANFSDAAAAWRSLRPLYDWYGVQLDNVEGTEVMIGGTLINHKSTMGENIKLLAPYAGVQLEKWFDVGENETLFTHPTKSLNERAILAFKTENDFLAFLADWGITTRISNNLDEVKNLDGDEFPNSVPGGFVPGGGDDTGYNNDPTIPSIPSYSDNTSDKIIPTTPNISAINAASTYALSLVDVKSLLNWLMTDNFINNISNLFSDKLAALDDLKIFPIDLVQHDIGHTQHSSTITIANVSDNTECYKILPAYNCIINGGNYHYVAYWGNANDYTSSTYYLYMPYAGIVELSPSHVVNCDLRLEYAVDIMTGSATAIIYSNDVLVKTIPCQIAQSVPITFSNTNQRLIRTALTALGAGNSLNNAASGVAMGLASGNVGGAVSSGIGGITGMGSSIVQNTLTNPLIIGSAGSFSSNTSLVMPQTPFLIISRTQLSIPSNRDNIVGQPSNINSTINSFVGSGFVQIKTAHINTTATTDEQNQIIAALNAGIFI